MMYNYYHFIFITDCRRTITVTKTARITNETNRYPVTANIDACHQYFVAFENQSVIQAYV